MRFRPVFALLIFITYSAGLPSVIEALQQRPNVAEQPPGRVDQERARIERDMAKKANQERQAALKRDTDKLFQLSEQLKEYVDKSNENVLSVNVLKKAEEIEKLAHSVKEKMKGN